VAGATKPVLDATAGVVGSVAAPAVGLGEAAGPVGDVVGDLTRPVGGALIGDRSSRPDRGSTLQPVATFGRPGSGGPSSGDGAGSQRPAAGGPSPGGQGAAPDSLPGATLGPYPATPEAFSGPGSAPDQPVTVSSDERPTTAISGRPAVTTGYLPALVSLADLAAAIAPPSPETSTSTSRTEPNSAQTSPERPPTPAPSAPAGAAAAGAASAGSAGPVLALLALLLLAAPGLSLFLRTAPEFLRPAPFIVALERPG
jgi:hypothetical protein